MKGQTGFTLVETLVAFAILSLTLIALYQAIGTSLRSFDQAASVEEAVMVARSRLDGIVALSRLPDVRRGKVEGTPYEWQVDELPFTQGTDNALQVPGVAFKPVLFRLTVSWPGATSRRKVSIDRLIHVRRQGS
jgi:general secretion pathway protein I